MPVVSDALSHSFIVDTVAKVFKADTFLNIVKRKEEVVYRSSVGANAANIAFVSNESVSSTNNLSIADRSTSLAANRVSDVDSTTIDGTDTFEIDTDSFVVTDVFAEQTNTITPEPLFYKHVISIENLPRVDPDNEDFTLDTGVKLLAVEILDQFLQPVRVPDKLLDLTTGILYNNLLSEFNTSGDYTVYYLKYTVNNNGTIHTFVDLLDNQTTFRVATFEDLTPLLQIIQDGRKVYLIEEILDGFQVTLPVIGTYAFKPLSTARIKIIPPVGTGVLDSWFVRVTNGKFFTNVGGTLYKYHIAEFLTQSFFPEAPIKEVDLENSTILSSNLIKLDHESIFENGDLELFVNIQINKADGSGVAAFTTNPLIVNDISPNGQPWKRWELNRRTGIRSIDHRIGVVEVEGISLKTSWVVESSYSFLETNYEFTLFNFNPISNKDAHSHKVSLFIDPDTVSTAKEQTLYYLKINQAGKVVESNWGDFDNSIQAYDPTGDPLYYEQYPDFLPPGDHHIFVDEFTVETSGNSSNFLILGDMTVSEAQGVDEAVTIDSRSRGGGILASSMAEALQLQPESQWYWDEGYWDGIPYPGNASYMVEVPVTIMENTPDGIFTQSEIKDVVFRHTAAGIYPSVRAYGVDATITGIYPFASGLEVEWFSNGY